MDLSGARLVVSGLVRCGGSVVIVKNSSPRGPQWSPPGGKVEPGETPIAAAIREIQEECGIVVVQPRRLVHATHMTFAAASGIETWISFGYEFLLDRTVDLPEVEDPDRIVSTAEWLSIQAASDRVRASAIEPVAQAFVNYCSDVNDLVTRYYEFDVDLAREPPSQSTTYFHDL